MSEHESAPESEHDALRESIDRATDELSELLRNPEANADAIVAKKKELAGLSAQLPPDPMEAVAQGLADEGGHIVKENEAATRVDMQAQLNDILVAVEKGERPEPATSEHAGALTEDEKKLRGERMQLLVGEARAFVTTFQTVLGELHGLNNEDFRRQIQNRLQGIADTALGRMSLSLEIASGIPTGIYKPDTEEVTPEMVDGFIHDVQGGTNLLEGLRKTIDEKKQ